eukprot:TRINITY_DN9422_c0_g1_i2.p1 TRINITY_DN9422_c0_g1~~TRINITY_DN9422_c0_g1_i2.p1  ORF type:complete len:608 (-),score=117.14 TRINITY_DN9422_c0_g1_i2:128-1951(-)
MARRGNSSSGSWTRLLKLSYYLRRPRRLAFVFVIIVCTTFLLWDRHNLVQEHQAVLDKLENEKEQLSRKLAEISIQREREVALEQTVDDHAGNRNPPELKRHVDKNAVGTFVLAEDRREKVKEAMTHAWRSYVKYAWGTDELQPQSKRGSNQFGGLGATIVDSLDTLYIMGLKEEFHKAKEWVTNNLDFNKQVDASVFETTIRYLGGLLSAYDLSQEEIFLERAQQLADRLLPAFNSPTGIPYSSINLATGRTNNPGWTGGSSVLADVGTQQVEYIALSERTADPKYREKAENVIAQIRKIFPEDGLVPIYISPENGQPTSNRITFGAMGDSFYEYLLKVWLLGNKTEGVKVYREMWEQSMEGMTKLIKKSSRSSFTYIAERTGGSLIDKMDELACFAPGMLALGADGAAPEKASRYLDLAKELALTCYKFYMTTPTRLAGENYNFRDGEDMSVGVSWNILRPETVESLMYLWRKTGDQKYRDWGWDIFQAFETQSRIDSGYVGLKDVNSGLKDDMMQSFFLAETLKYLYLLFSPSDVIPLDEWVFNTEAHPLKITSRVDEPYVQDVKVLQATTVEKGEAAGKLRNSIMQRARQRKRGRKEGRVSED